MNRRRSRVSLLLMLAITAQVLMGCRAAGRTPAEAARPSQNASPSVLAPTPAATPVATPTASPSATPSPAQPATSTPSEGPTEETGAGAQEQSTAFLTTLQSLRQVDDYPLYTMRYYGAYSPVASSPRDAGWAGPAIPARHWSCSLFAALGNSDRILYGRNFDWRYSPALLLFTDPPDGYASVSMVDIAYLVSAGDVGALTDLPLQERAPLLSAPFWPFDGMNEHGLVVGMAAVPESEMPFDASKETIDSLRVIREILDHARDVKDAVSIMRRYNVVWDGGPALHYLIADGSGRSVLVEFYAGQMVLLPSPARSAWHLATNHLRATVENDTAPSGCWRYDEIRRRLTKAEGRLAPPDALNLLADVSQENTQWSVVYDAGAGRISVAMGRAFDDEHTFCLGPEGLASCAEPQ